MCGERPQLSAETLSRIMLLQGMMGQLPDESRICGFVCQGLQDLPGVGKVRYQRDPVTATATGNEIVFTVEISRRCYGAFIATLAEPGLFAPYEAYVRNLCFMVAVVLEERRQRAANVAYQKELELRVEERTSQLVQEVEIRQAAEARAIAERQRAEEYLRVAEVIIVDLDDKARIQRINPRGCALLGRPLDELVGRNWFDVAVPGDQRAIEAVEYHESDIVDVTGRRYHIAWHNVHRRRDDGMYLGTLSSGLDITERKLAEQRLASEKENLAVTLRSIGDAVITTDIRGNVLLMNAVAERLTGFTQSEAAGQPLSACFRIIHQHTRAPCGNPVDKVLDSNQIVELENHTVLVAKDGREYAIADSGAPIRASDGSVCGVVLVFRDMTEKYRMVEMAQRTDRLESLGILAGGIAHDFNNLLGGIFGYLELAQLEATEPAVRQDLAAAAVTIERARGLTRQLLTFAKGGAPVKRGGNLVPVIKENVRFALSGTNVSCQLDLPDDLWSCVFDPVQVSQVIDNLVINAAQAMPTGGSIEIVARNIALKEGDIPPLAAGPFVKIHIRDTGSGIPPALLQRIFDPFFTTKQTGNGLGLATAYSIVKRHDGTILVDSQPGCGTTFTLYFPAAPALAAAPAPRQVPSQQGRGSILVMDDERALLDVTTKFLASLGYKVLTACDGREAIDLFVRTTSGNHDVVAVILDLTIPGGLGGKEAAAAIRQRDPAMPIFVASGYAQDPIMAAPKEHGFTDSLCKPYTRSDLSALLARHRPAT
jgi:PAS domain S-box-containing protein